MRLFDPFAYLSRRSSADHQALARGGVHVVVEPCGPPGRPRTQASSFEDQFAGLVGFERSRAGQFGLRYFAALALGPVEANDAALALPVLNLLPYYLACDNVVAVGETGYESMTPAEDSAFEWQLDLARRQGLPALVRVPASERAKATRRALDVIQSSGLAPGRVALGPCDEETLHAVLDAGCWASFALCARARFDAARMAAACLAQGTQRLLVGSGADWDLSDAIAIPAVAEYLRQTGLAEGAIESLLWSNPLAFFSLSGRLPADLAAQLNASARPRKRTTPARRA